jgi:catechol 2,3-dioxygenase-like lactoylglutathione lyase family enzyme
MAIAMEIGAIVWGVTNIKRAVDFWCAALGYQLKYPASDDWAILVPKNGSGIQMSISLASSAKAKRHHIDLFSDSQKEEVERLVALGATRADWRYPPDADYVVLHDPDGNPFCVVQR